MDSRGDGGSAVTVELKTAVFDLFRLMPVGSGSRLFVGHA